MKPKIFVSSTVLDFEDLRSSIKYFLEKYGFDIQMSEYPTFDVDLNKSTFDACLKNLEKCDYFILLIGYRRGGWYKENEISITHKEFRTAKKLVESGHRIRILSFVRKPIWLLRKDRDSIIKHFQSISDKLSAVVANTGSTIIDDPKYIFNFINEVSEGINISGATHPINNWIYDFDSFEDIAYALQNTLKLDVSLELKKQKSLLVTELTNNYEKFILPNISISENKESSSLEHFTNILHYYRNRLYPLIIPVYDDVMLGKKQLIISGEEISYLFLYSIIYPIMKRSYDLSTTILEKILKEGIFLEYDVTENDFRSTITVFALQKLLEWINNFKKATSSPLFLDFTNEVGRLSSDGSAHHEKVVISKTSVGCIMLLSVANRIPELISCILEYFNSKDESKLKEFDYSDKYK